MDISTVDKVDLSKNCANVILWLKQQSAQQCWDLSDDEMATLLGGIQTEKWKYWQEISEDIGMLDLELKTIERLSLLAGIYKAIHQSVPIGLHYSSFKRPVNHPLFEGLSVKEYLLKNSSINDFYEVRNYFLSRT
ncbi:hypothetical protein [Kangiella sp.]|uniref:hypothetical protein n=1 Tax=Kangiella sp. TaxID=1920245 RepID=UPI003A943914